MCSTILVTDKRKSVTKEWLWDSNCESGSIVASGSREGSKYNSSNGNS